MASRVMCIVLTLHLVSGSDNYYYRKEGFMDHFNTGIKMVQNLLGSESVALKVADLVVRAFNTGSTPSGKRRPAHGGPGDPQASEEHLGLQEAPPAAPWHHLLRLLGLRPEQLSAVAVNAVVFVAQMITSFLAGPRRPPAPFRSDDPTDWILNKNSKKLQDLLATAKNESLTDQVEELVANHGNAEETSCIRLLVCKITPFVSGMQEAVFRKASGRNYDTEYRGAAVLYRHLPSSDEIKSRSDACEKRFPECELNE